MEQAAAPSGRQALADADSAAVLCGPESDQAPATGEAVLLNRAPHLRGIGTTGLPAFLQAMQIRGQFTPADSPQGIVRTLLGLQIAFDRATRHLQLASDCPHRPWHLIGGVDLFKARLTALLLSSLPLLGLGEGNRGWLQRSSGGHCA